MFGNLYLGLLSLLDSKEEGEVLMRLLSRWMSIRTRKRNPGQTSLQFSAAIGHNPQYSLARHANSMLAGMLVGIESKAAVAARCVCQRLAAAAVQLPAAGLSHHSNDFEKTRVSLAPAAGSKAHTDRQTLGIEHTVDPSALVFAAALKGAVNTTDAEWAADTASATVLMVRAGAECTVEIAAVQSVLGSDDSAEEE